MSCRFTTSTHPENVREKGSRRNPGSLGKTFDQVLEEENKNLDNTASFHFFEVPGEYQDHFFKVKNNYLLSLLKRYNSLEIFIVDRFRSKAFSISTCSVTLKTSRAREELSNRSRQTIVPV